MRTDKQHVLIVGIKRQRPDSLTRKTIALRIDSRPRLASIRAAVNTTADLADLVCIANEYLVAITRVDQDAGEVAERKIPTANSPRCATVLRHIERLLGANVEIVRSLRILRDRVYRNLSRNTVYLRPRFSAIARNEHARTRRSDPDRFRVLQICGNARRPWIEASVRKLLPTFCRIETAI